jgi:hypothetical protein
MKKLSYMARVCKLCFIATMLLAALGTLETIVRVCQAKGDNYAPQYLHPQPAFRYAIIYDDPRQERLAVTSLFQWTHRSFQNRICELFLDCLA